MCDPHPYTMPKVDYDKAKKALDALHKKFPLSDKRKQDISDADDIRLTCIGISPQNYEKLVEVSKQIGRLKTRLKANEPLAKSAYNMMARLTVGPFERQFSNDKQLIGRVKKGTLSEDDKSKEITRILIGQIASMTTGAEAWAVLRDQSDGQVEAMAAIGRRLKDANKELQKKIRKSKKGVKHLKLAAKASKDLVEMVKLRDNCSGHYIMLNVELSNHVKGLQKNAINAGKVLAKMKAKSAMEYFEKLVA